MKVQGASNKASNAFKLVFLGLLGTGIAGNGYWTYKNAKEQTVLNSRLNELTSEINQRTFDYITISKVAEKVLPSTVSIEGELEQFDFFTGKMQKIPAVGSGIILITEDNQKFILTCSHVIEDAEIKKDGKSYYRVKLYNGSDSKPPVEFYAEIAKLKNGKIASSRKEELDLTLLKIPDDVTLPKNAGVLFRDINKEPLKAGEGVIAVGNPYEQRDSVSFGIISHTDRKALWANKNNHVQTDTSINLGNSGGGLFDMHGRLVAINALAYGRSNGVAMSTRIDDIQKVLNDWEIGVPFSDK